MKRESLIAGFWIVLLTALLLAVGAWGQTAPTASLDFTGGIPAGVEPKQASGTLTFYESYKCGHVKGIWYLPYTLQPGERMEIDVNPRYEINGGFMVGDTKVAVTRYTISPIVIQHHTGPVALYGSNASVSNQAQWLRVRYWQNPTPTPTETATETPSPTITETPTATATIPEATEEILTFYFDDLRSGWRWEIKATRRL